MFTIWVQQQLLNSQQCSTQQTAVAHIPNTAESNTAELSLFGRLVIRIGLALPVNISCNCITFSVTVLHFL